MLHYTHIALSCDFDQPCTLEPLSLIRKKVLRSELLNYSSAIGWSPIATKITKLLISLQSRQLDQIFIYIYINKKNGTHIHVGGVWKTIVGM